MNVGYFLSARTPLTKFHVLASRGGEPRTQSARLPGGMTTDNGIALVLAYLLVSAVVLFAFLLVVFAIGWFIGRVYERRRGRRGEE